MTKFLLSVHVLAAIVAIGPVTVAASLFPRSARAALAALAAPGDIRAVAVVRTWHRICRVYSAVGVFVPAFGLATAASLGVLTEAWLIAAMILTASAAAVLLLAVLPSQQRLLAAVETASPATPALSQDQQIRRETSRLAMVAGVFNLLWAAVTVLMIVRPGSMTGV